ncbi:hypothetical protein BFP97_14135 [Roseivirga sp. 4D4]|uniref:type IX secretion system motor protein PorM/GldM n=1 Tax=Roseivirga sp. 4D4 TaxID=1889784 RepID=UPI000853255C|nr:GldM family protein [Roseivirga sp. 4D4]OEK02591.1 hypothetical protein BFP97_14135 [Roseivirga sp. 4D4]
MAGGKETPRQKMIGMMYLVLTALLALQIKDSVLEKFVLMESGLEVSNASFLDYNQTILGDIQSDVVNQGDKQGDQAVAKVAEGVRNYTNGLAAYLDNLKYELGKVSTGGDTSKLRKRSTLKKYEEPSNYMVNQGFADELKAKLDEYPEKVNGLIALLGKDTMTPEWMESIALKADDIKMYENNQEEKKKDYADFNFYKAPLASVLAQLTFYKNQIYSKEAVALNKLKSFVGTAVSVNPNDIPSIESVQSAPATQSSEPQQVAENDNVANTPSTTPSQPSNTSSDAIDPEDFLTGAFAGIDYAEATVLSESNIITAGLPFKAQAFLTLGNSKLEPTVKMNGQDVTMLGGRGQIDFPTSARESEYDANGLAKKTFEVEITADDGTGSQITRTTTHEYFVARPVIDVRSQSVDVLYLNCNNNLTINVPALGPVYQPRFTVTGATYTQGSTKGQVSVVPNNRAVKIDVSSGGQYIGFREFEARNVPLPALDVRPNGQVYNPNVGLTDMPTRLDLRLNPDAAFAEKYPDDANFYVTKGTIYLTRGTQRKGQIRIDGLTPDVDLSSIRARMASGDQLVVSIEEIARVNYKSEQIPIVFVDNMTMIIN